MTSTPEQAAQAESVELSYQDGTSDKVYRLRLENDGDNWTVRAEWGRRGKALQSGVKASGVTYGEAKRLYDRLVEQKRGKGYQIARGTNESTIRTSGDADKEGLKNGQ
jgi:predicted DNA-binding WGR domain protein